MYIYIYIYVNIVMFMKLNGKYRVVDVIFRYYSRKLIHFHNVLEVSVTIYPFSSQGLAAGEIRFLIDSMLNIDHM